GRALQDARSRLEAALASGDEVAIGEVLATADPVGAGRAKIRWKREAAELTGWTRRLWEAADGEAGPAGVWAARPIPRGGLGPPAAVLHLKDPQRFQPWDHVSRQGFARLAEEAEAGDLVERYRLFNEGAAWLCQHYRLHPLELPGLLAAVAESDSEPAGGPT